MATHATANADIEALRRIASEFTAGFNTRDVDRIMRFYGESYVDVNLRHPVQTWEERRRYYLEVMQRPGLQIEVVPDEVLVEGNLGFVRGSIFLSSDGAPSTELRYLEIARKTAEGSWKVFWGMDGPIQEYQPKSA